MTKSDFWDNSLLPQGPVFLAKALKRHIFVIMRTCHQVCMFMSGNTLAKCLKTNRQIARDLLPS